MGAWMKLSKPIVPSLGHVRRARFSKNNVVHGFTVLEMLIALVILGLGLSALSGATSDSLMRTTRANMDAKAPLVAEGLLAQLGATIPIREGLGSGRSDGIDWTVTMTPYGSDEDRSAWPVKPEAIALTLNWQEAGARKSATWRTILSLPTSSASP